MRIGVRIAASCRLKPKREDESAMPRRKKPTGAAAIPVVEGDDEAPQTTAAEETSEVKEVPQPNEPIRPKRKPVKKAGSPKAQLNGTPTTSTIVALIRAATAYGSLDEAIELLQAIKAAK
jgi:hypothetical protein